MVKRINFHQHVRMDKACDREGQRISLSYIYFKDGFAYASEGHILVANKLSEMCNFPEEQLAHLDGKLLHKDNYRRILDFDNVRITSDGISCRWDGCSATFYFCDLDIRYPDVQKTLRDSRALPDCLLAHIGFGLELLAVLSDAMAGIATSGDGFRHVKFTFKGDSKPVIITCKEYESMALIMPCLIGE